MPSKWRNIHSNGNLCKAIDDLDDSGNRQNLMPKNDPCLRFKWRDQRLFGKVACRTIIKQDDLMHNSSKQVQSWLKTLERSLERTQITDWWWYKVHALSLYFIVREDEWASRAFTSKPCLKTGSKSQRQPRAESHICGLKRCERHIVLQRNADTLMPATPSWKLAAWFHVKSV